MDAAVRDGLEDEHSLSERELGARAQAREDREAAARDRWDSADDRRSAESARDAARRSGD